jgi:uncharacterized protein YjbI with pentapeptide repeats
MDSPPPDLLSWAFWFKDSTSVRDLLVSLAAVIGLPLLIWREITGHRTVDIAAKRHEKQTEADRERRITDSFTKAVELLGKPELEVRLGAIYALERIARESKHDHWPIMETLTAYVRTKAPFQGDSKSNQSYSSTASAYAMVVAEGTIEAAQTKMQCSPKTIGVDIQAVLIVINRRNIFYETNQNVKKRVFPVRRGKWELIFWNIRDQLGFRIRMGNGLNQYINLSKADLSGADMSRANLNWAALNGANLSGANLIGADLNDANLRGANLSRADLTQANLIGADLSGTNLNGANLNGVNLRDNFLIGTDLSEANLSGANLSGLHLLETNLSGADLSRAYLRRAFLSGVNLREADMRRADLSRANLRRADLTGADLSRADLSRADLRNADLAEADLTGADLSGANLIQTKLSGANLTQAKLNRANLSGADLSGANLTQAKLSGAKFCEAIMPDDTVNNRDCPSPAP